MELLDYIMDSVTEHSDTSPFHLVQSGKLKELKKVVNWGKVDPGAAVQGAPSKQTLLHVAAAFNQVDIINYLIVDCKVNVNKQDSDGNTALHLAVLNGHIEAINALFCHKSDDTILNGDLNPPLHLAIMQGARGKRLISEFIRHPHVNLFVQGNHDYTTLHVIAKYNNMEALKLIHDEVLSRMQLELYGSNFYLMQKGRNGFNIFHVSAREGSAEFLDFILSKCAEHGISAKGLLNVFCKDNRSPLHYAVERGHVECIRLILKHGGDPVTMKGYHAPPLHLACSLGKLNVVKLMMNMCGKGILLSLDHEGGTPLHSSTSSLGSEEMISYLVTNGVPLDAVDTNGLTALSNAILFASISTIEGLLKYGADPLIKDKWGHNALHRSVQGKRMTIFRKIASHDKAKVMAECSDSNGNYPIHYALRLGMSEMIPELLVLTPNTFRDKDRNNYVHLAALSGNLKSCTLTGGFQHMINETNRFGFTPLHYAAMGSNIASVKKFLDSGAVIHKSHKGCTPFMCACSKGKIEIAKLLYENNKFQRDWIDYHGNTALHFAVDGGNPDVVTFCMDEGMAITLNDSQLSFFDKILQLSDKTLAECAIRHKRWEECFNVASPNLSHPIMRMIDRIPDVYGIVLDQCFTTCSLDPQHPDYWEEFNFKGLILKPVLSKPEEMSEEQKNDESGDINGEEMVDFDQIHFQHHIESYVATKDLEAVQRSRIGNMRRRRAMTKWQKRMAKEEEGTLAVVQKLIKNQHESFLLHPVVVAFIRTKWEGFGQQVYLIIMLIHFLLALFLTIFMSLIPIPEQEIDIPTTANASGNATAAAISTGAQAMLYTTLLMALLNLLIFAFHVYIHGFSIILRFLSRLQVWSNLLAVITTIIFLASVLANGIDNPFWNSAAIAVFFAWTSFGLMLQYINIFDIGVYITLLISTTALICKVLAVLFVFLLALALPFYILVGTEQRLQYGTIGLSLFNNLHTLVGVTDFLGFVSLEQSGEIRFSILVFLFLVVVVILLPIVVINLLIGLAVGDIARIQREAVVSQRSIEVQALATVLDHFTLPRKWIKQLSQEQYRHYPNQYKLSSLLTGFFHRSFDSKAVGFDGQVRTLLRKELAVGKEFERKRLDKIEVRLEQVISDQAVQLEGIKRLEKNLAKITKILEVKD